MRARRRMRAKASPGRRQALAAAATAAALGVALSACSSSLSVAGTERQIAAQLTAQYQVGKPVVACPAHLRAASGARFVCTASIEGQPLPIDVTYTGGHLADYPAAAVLAVPHAVAVLRSDIAAQVGGAPPAVDCGGHTLLVVAPGHTFSCTATIAGQSRQVTATVRNLQGAVTFVLAPPAAGPAATLPPVTAPSTPTSAPQGILPGG
ncbi:MAG: DUF4333 domain-containing protein [Acidimicrobiales bacterium]